MILLNNLLKRRKNMKKSFILASILALSSTTLMAVDAKNNWFTGLEAGKTKHNHAIQN